MKISSSSRDLLVELYDVRGERDHSTWLGRHLKRRYGYDRLGFGLSFTALSPGETTSKLGQTIHLVRRWKYLWMTAEILAPPTP